MDFAALHVDEITFPMAAAEKNVNKKNCKQTADTTYV